MRIFKTFWYVLTRSYSSLSYYKELMHVPLSFSLKYFGLYFFLFSTISVLYLTIRIYIPFGDFIARLPNHVSTIYPDELVISINRGHVSTNVDEPYFIPSDVLDPITNDFEENVLGTTEHDMNNLLVIDTNSTPDQIFVYSTWALLSWNTLTYINEDGFAETVPLDNVQNIIIDQNKIMEFSDNVNPLIQYVVSILVLSTLLGYLLWGLYLLLTLMFTAVILYLIGRAMKKNVSFKQAYQICLHLILIPITIFTILSFLGLEFGLWFKNTLFVLIVGSIILKKLPEKPKGGEIRA